MDQILHELSSVWDKVVAVLVFDTARLSEPDMVVRLALQVVLLLASAYFSGSETALFSLSRLDLQKLRRERNRHSETLHELLDQPRRLIISLLCGNELVNIAAAANMAGILVVLYGPERAGLVSVFVMVPLILLFGEVTPKTIAVANPVRVSTGLVAGPMSVWLKAVAPVLWLIRGISDRITTLLVGEEKSPENILQIDEFRTLVETGAEEGQLNAVERALIHNLLESGDTEIVEIMTPRTRTKFISDTMDVAEALERFREYRHPRVPVYRGSRDNLVGFLHTEDMLRLVLDDVDLDTLTLAELLRPPVVAPLTKKVDEMFDFFQANQARAAAVLNEFGGVEGFVTMKDVLTFIFGQISGDVRGQELYRERDENVYEVPGEMKLTDFNNLTHFGLEDPRMTTIGGVAFRYLDRMPQVGNQAIVEGFVITVLEVEAHRIARVRVARGDGVDARFEDELQDGSGEGGGASIPAERAVEDPAQWPEEASRAAEVGAERADRDSDANAVGPSAQDVERSDTREAVTQREE
jgi:CBS domain containing-hemolysin-like protein